MRSYSRNSLPPLFEVITEGIVSDLDAGRVTRWEPSWQGGGHERNARTKRLYLGRLNVLVLWCSRFNNDFSTQEWVSALQIARWGGRIKSGETPTTIMVGRRGNRPGQRSFGRLLQVYNVDQCEGLPTKNLPDPSCGWSFPRLERLIIAMGIDFRIGGRDAFYHFIHDYICVPDIHSHHSHLYAARTWIHELCHSTKHRSRLDRQLSANHMGGSVAAALEEIAVEMATAFVLARMGLRVHPVSPSYIAAWLQFAKTDSSLLFDLAPVAAKIANYILAFDQGG